jgi:hypothetical protein
MANQIVYGERSREALLRGIDSLANTASVAALLLTTEAVISQLAG